MTSRPSSGSEVGFLLENLTVKRFCQSEFGYAGVVFLFLAAHQVVLKSTIGALL